MTIRCLLVEDEFFTRDVLSLTLRRANFDVDVVEGGKQALACLEDQTYDVIIIDLHMPGLNGYDLIRIIREDEHLQHLNLVAITANPSAISSPEAQMADAFLTKPLDIKFMIERIKKLVSVGHS